jgi:plasmid replication initiation protein
MGNYIAIDITDTQTGKRKWQRFNWFTWAEVDEKTKVATMIFSPQIAEALLELKKTCSKVNLNGQTYQKFCLLRRFPEISPIIPDLTNRIHQFSS